MQNLTLENARKEINRLLQDHRKDWKRIPGKDERFVNDEHQKRYDLLKDIKTLTESIKQTELHMFKQRWKANQMKQPKLF